MSKGEQPAMLRCEDVGKFFRRRLVLNDISLRLSRGKTLGVIGPGGAGKSLLAKILCGLVRPDRGRVWLEGREITGLSERALQSERGKVGMVFQNYALFDFMTVAQNIAFPLEMERRYTKAEIERQVEEILDLVALPGVGEKKPAQLSGGMKKRVSFARAVVRRPSIVIYDDPTAGLDPVTSAKIFDLVAEMSARGSTGLIISHDIDGMKPLCCDWLVLDQGQAVFAGDSVAMDKCGDPFVQHFWRGAL